MSSPPLPDTQVPATDPDPPSDSEDEVEAADDDDDVNIPMTQQTAQALLPVMERPFDPADVPEENKRVSRYAEALGDDLHHLVTLVWDEHQREPDRIPVVMGLSFEDWRDLCMPILCATPQVILNELVGGNLTRAVRKNPDAERVTNLYKKRAEHGNAAGPGIYHIVLVDEEGLSPTPRELLKVIEAMRQYCDTTSGNDSIAFDIDNAVKSTQVLLSQTQPGERRYLEKVGWSAALEARIKQLPTDLQDKPLHPPLRYIGYGNPAKRLENHIKHQSSNYIMNLTESTCRAVWKNRGFRVEGFPIYWCETPEACIASEVLFTAIADGYTREGGGFSHHPAGQNNKCEDVTLAQWECNCLWVDKLTPLELSIRAFNARKWALRENERQHEEADDLSAQERPNLEAADGWLDDNLMPEVNRCIESVNETTALLSRLLVLVYGTDDPHPSEDESEEQSS
ncbi:uncharacterized protein K452DRAFT_310478 [Aplosporella prunicola CBS 121167]|uniref:Uncharacterized protein n=1 Tax=Aplosporella prunicola CBS 121167 TaxID=1176127 RepID=A0A6A6B7C6_9PEZI|nr:uncharacterized protein K452DRAFT_310478 [Aplosporella prunicola CBS 121167]KAF2139518.1 hypothetical protein K452DRAFT_310478 [Aplosporella prunicola CBS 121167]